MVFRPAREANGERDYRTALIDGLINSGLTFFSTLMASSTIGGMNVQSCMAAGLATGITFFASLILSLNIRKVEPVDRPA